MYKLWLQAILCHQKVPPSLFDCIFGLVHVLVSSLEMYIHVLFTVIYPDALFSFSGMSVTCQRQDPVEGHLSVGW